MEEAPPCTEADLAANALRRGGVVDWQPGDGTRYACLIVERFHDGQQYDHRRWLLIENFGSMVLPLGGLWTPQRFVATPWAPVGSWAGLRPLLCALDCASGGTEYRRSDATAESAARLTHDGMPPNSADAQLGRKVRRLIEAER